MSNPDYYVNFESLTTETGEFTDSAYADAKTKWLCPGCLRPKPGVERMDVHIQNRRLKGPLSFISGCGIPLAALSFLFRLGEKRVKRDLWLGDVFGPDGVRLDDWVTFRGKRGLIVRGTEHAGNRICPDCGRNCYFAMHPCYLHPQPPTDVEIFQSGLSGLIVPDYVASEAGIGGKIKRVRGAELIDWPNVADINCKPRRILVERLRVLQEPKDGLPPLSF